jgi:two-component system phosphate regulon response regulator OmpR
MDTLKTRILVVDDDARLRELLNRYLTEQGMQVMAAADGAGMDKVLARNVIDLIVLDLMLPREDGLAICRRLRATGKDVPIIMLTAKGEEVDRILGLEMGADDYLPKPFNPRELLARIHAVLRRRAPAPPPGAPAANAAPVAFGRYVLDLTTRTLTRDGAKVALTTGEFSLLKVLALHPGEPLSRDKLMELARGRELEPFDRSIDVQVSRLRKLIEDDPAAPRYIQTVWGFGYVFVPDAGAGAQPAADGPADTQR